MFISPFPAGVAFASFDTSNGPPPTVHPDEEALVPPRSVEMARTTLRLGRHAAHRALASLGFDENMPLLRNPDDSACWPGAVVGSISHTKRESFVVAVAVAGKRSQTESLGLDIEDLRRKVSEPFIKRVCTPQELLWIELVPALRIRRVLQIFSAKETLFKLFAPVFDGPKTFQGANLVHDARLNIFEATLTPAISARYPAFSRHRISIQEANDFVLTSGMLAP